MMQMSDWATQGRKQPPTTAGFESECQARINGDMLDVHGHQGKAEECGAI